MAKVILVPEVLQVPSALLVLLEFLGLKDKRDRRAQLVQLVRRETMD